jgi:uncharacterized oxidoreductase
MKMSDNTILITGGGSGIGRGLAQAFHRLGNQVIIAGRRLDRLQATIDANPGMVAVELDVRDPRAIRRVTAEIVTPHPSLNVLINNAGIMQLDDVAKAADEDLLTATIDTNLSSTIRMSGALVVHLKTRPDPVIINVSSVLGFVPMAAAAIYSATKAAIHSYTLSQRYKLRAAGIRVIEIAPPWVRTELLNSLEEARAMPFDEFISSTMAQLATDSEEILVGRAVQLRANAGPTEHNGVSVFNDRLAAGPPLDSGRTASAA